MPATSILISAASSGISAIGNSRISVLLGPVLTAARTFSTTAITSACFRCLLASTPACSCAIYRFMMLWFLIGCSMMPASTKVQPLKKSPAYHEALARVREWTRERFTLAADATILVSEIACGLPGCPPLETVVVFWIGETRHHFKFFKTVHQAVFSDFS